MVSLGISLFGGAVQAQEWTTLFNGRDFGGWREPMGTWAVHQGVSLNPSDPKAFAVTEGQGVMLNSPASKTVDAVTVEEFGDCRLQVEFCVAKGSNSGIYFQGRYEVQVLDSYGKAEVGVHDCGAIYERWNDQTKKGFEGTAPRLNASKEPGEWQSFDISFVAPKFGPDGKKTANAKFLRVIHNGKVVHENVEVTGPTRGGKGEESVKGPIRLQGDHGPVAYRNLKISKSVAP